MKHMMAAKMKASVKADMNGVAIAIGKKLCPVNVAVVAGDSVAVSDAGMA